MKNIKYRALTDEFDGFIYNIPYVDGFGNWCMKNPISDKGIIVKKETITIGTGKIDKNNVEIFEGDIIAIPFLSTHDIHRFVVQYDSEYMSFTLHQMYKDSNEFCPIPMYFCQMAESLEYNLAEVEVVGNIFDMIP